MKTSAMYEKLQSGTKVLSLALVLLMLATVGSAQTGNDTSTPLVGRPSGAAPKKNGQMSPFQPKDSHYFNDSDPTSMQAPVAGVINNQSDTVFYQTVNDPSGGDMTISIPTGTAPWSKVFVSICESDGAGNCFQGAAHPRIFNVVPGWNTTTVGFSPNWPWFPVNLRFSLLIDP
jgi:hypothetical protein